MSSWKKQDKDPTTKKALKKQRLISYEKDTQRLPEKLRGLYWRAEDGFWYWKIVTAHKGVVICNGGPFKRKTRLIISIQRLVEAIRLHEFNITGLTNADTEHIDDIKGDAPDSGHFPRA